MMRCPACQSTLLPGTTACPTCNTSLTEKTVAPLVGATVDEAMYFGPFIESAPTPPGSAPNHEKIYQQTGAFANQAPYAVLPHQPYAQPAFPSQPPAVAGKRKLSTRGRALLIMLALLTVCGVALIYYTAVYLPIADIPQDLYDRVTKRTPVIDDPLNDANNSAWTTSKEDYGSCQFLGNVYYVTTTVQDTNLCLLHAVSYLHVGFQVQLKILQDSYSGIAFRSRSPGFTGYTFMITSTGRYEVIQYRNSNAETLVSRNNSLINNGLRATNVLTVIAIKDKIYLYINQRSLVTLTDSLYNEDSPGYIGFFDSNTTTYPSADTAFSNAKVWDLPANV